jgi:hypothetical protein
MTKPRWVVTAVSEDGRGEQTADDLFMGVDVELADGNTSVVILGVACWSGDLRGQANPAWATSVAVRA